MRSSTQRILGTALLGVVAMVAWWHWGGRVEAPMFETSPRPDLTKKSLRRLPGAMNAAMRAGGNRHSQQGHALEDLMAGRSFLLIDNGQARRFRLSLNELYLPTAEAGKRLQTIAPQPDAPALLQRAKEISTGNAPAGLVLYPEESNNEPALRRVLHTRLLLKVREPAAAQELLRKLRLRLIDQPDYAPGLWIVEPVEGGPVAALRALQTLNGAPAIDSASPMLLHLAAKKLLPNDLFFNQQWHLKNTGQGGGKVGIDANVTPVWDTLQGQGVRIGIVDDGLDMLHPDLLPNLDTANHYDWNDNPDDTNPAARPSNGDDHGTAVAGIAGARGNNNIGVTGAAPGATLVGYRLIAEFTSDAQDANAMIRGNDVVAIKNCSWGHADGFPWAVHNPGPLITAAREAAVTTGRGGLGTVLVWAAGNGRDRGDQGNKDSFSNSMYAVTVGAVDNRGALSSYSETGAHLTVAAPSSGGTRTTTTTDLRGPDGYNNGFSSGEIGDSSYTNSFGGTSSSTPVVSGVVALMLQANPSLTWRDVKEILLRSSVKVAPTDPGWVLRSGGNDPTLPLIKHHTSYGGGIVDAQAAVQMSKTWLSAAPATKISRSHDWSLSAPSIPDNKQSGLTIPFDFSDAAALRVEHVTVSLSIYHDYRGDLEISLRSPGGTISTLAMKENRDDGADYDGWTFSSMRHWGEPADGVWQLIVKDLASQDEGYITDAEIVLHGTPAPPASIESQSGPQLLAEGESLNLTSQTGGYGFINHQWRRSGTLVSNNGGYVVASVKTSHAGTYQLTASNLTGTAQGIFVPVAVVRRHVASVTVKEGLSTSLKVVTAGPGLAWQWFKGDEALTDNGDLSGSQTATLTIRDAEAADGGPYFCRVTLPAAGLVLDTLAATVTVLEKPEVTAPDFETGIVSGPITYTFTASPSAARFSASGVPPGMVFNTLTGTLAGRPNAAGIYTIKVTAANTAGTGAVTQSTWVIDAYPLSGRGTFTGLISRDPAMTAAMGGAFRITVGSTGPFSGILSLGNKVHRFTGRMDALPGEAGASALVTILRPKPLGTVQLTFEIDLSTGLLTGTVGDGTNQTMVTARRNPWSNVRKASHAGRYHALLESPAGVEEESEFPTGDGFLIVNTSVAGIATWSGKLGDGTALTGSSTFAEQGETSFHQLLYSGTGSVQGWSAITAASGMLDGDAEWFKATQPSTSRTRYFKTGFANHPLIVIGARYVKPAAGTPVLGLPLPEPGSENARLTFTAGGLADALSQSFTLTNASGIKMPAGAANPYLVRLGFHPTTGLITGSFAIKAADPTDTKPPIAILTRTATFSGALITRPGYNQGRGHFLLPKLPEHGPPKTTTSTSPILSGRVVLDAATP